MIIIIYVFAQMILETKATISYDSIPPLVVQQNVLGPAPISAALLHAPLLTPAPYRSRRKVDRYLRFKVQRGLAVRGPKTNQTAALSLASYGIFYKRTKIA